MHTPTDIFDEFLFRNRGQRRLNESHVPDGPQRQLLSWHRSQAKHLIEPLYFDPAMISTRPLPPIHFDIIDEANVDAVAFVTKNIGFIGISDGALFAIYDMFYRMLSHPGVFTYIGDPMKEIIQPFHANGLHRNYNNTLNSLSKGLNLDVVKPRCPVRKHYADLFSTYAVGYIILHEIAHIRHGHCEFCVDRYAMEFICELTENVIRDDDALTRQALELNADAFATSQTCAFIHYGHPGFSPPTWNAIENYGHDSLVVKRVPPESQREHAKEEYLHWLITSDCLYWLLGGNVDYSKVYQADHPPPWQRLLFNCSWTQDFFFTLNKDLEFKSDGVLAKVKSDVMDAVRAIGAGSIREDVESGIINFMGFAESEMKSYVKLLMNRLRGLVKDLNMYSHVLPAMGYITHEVQRDGQAKRA